MSDRNRLKVCAQGSAIGAVSRRDLLRMGGAVTAAGILLPAWVPAAAQSASTFDYYISPTGSDSNPGTLSAPWAITSLKGGSSNWSKLDGKGVRVGLLPGTYNVSAMMRPNDPMVGAIQFPGGTSTTPNYLASCNSQGVYSPRTATITAKTANGVYGGGISSGPGSWDGPIIDHSGQYPVTYTHGYVTFDGIVFTGFSYKAMRIGGASSGDGPAGLLGVTVQNCEFTGGNCSANPKDNCSAIWIDGCTGALVTNNYVHDNIGPVLNSGDHLNAIIVWGPNNGSASSTTSGTVIQYNTCINAGSIYGKEKAIQGSTIQFNYIDCSMFTANNSVYGIQDFTGAATSGLTQTTVIRNNVVLSSAYGIGRPTLSDAYGYSTPVSVYNNTIVLSSTAGGAFPALWLTCESPASGQLKVYNNIYTGAPDHSGFGAFLTNPSGPVIWDYNLFLASSMSWVLRSNSSLTSTVSSAASLSSWQSAFKSGGGTFTPDTHSIANNTPGFANSGALAQRYQLTSSSPAKGTGSTTGASGGSACDMGAWGNGATQIGCNFVSGSGSTSPVPDAPTLTVS